jgi:Na+-transporting methylmalonyl-CoA/oxaloacetate decarboxylase beta subunit
MFVLRSVAAAALLSLVPTNPARAAGAVRAKTARAQAAHVDRSHAKSRSAAELVAYYHYRQLAPVIEPTISRSLLARLRRR